MEQGSGKIVFALDGVANRTEAENWVKNLIPVVYRFKVGKELFTREGPEVVKAIRGLGGKVFLDLKFHDIPETVSRAVEAAGEMGAEIVDVHASGGREMLKAARNAAQSVNERKGKEITKVIAVTVLTSLDQVNLKEIGIDRELEDQVLRLARLSRETGLDGVVASPGEVEKIRREIGKDFLIVTPGIRTDPERKDDQKRVGTPEAAIQAGADMIVVGRDIRRSRDPIQKALEIESEIRRAGRKD